jgi:hypothetical protein
VKVKQIASSNPEPINYLSRYRDTRDNMLSPRDACLHFSYRKSLKSQVSRHMNEQDRPVTWPPLSPDVSHFDFFLLGFNRGCCVRATTVYQFAGAFCEFKSLQQLNLLNNVWTEDVATGPLIVPSLNIHCLLIYVQCYSKWYTFMCVPCTLVLSGTGLHKACCHISSQTIICSYTPVHVYISYQWWLKPGPISSCAITEVSFRTSISLKCP